jgi:integrase
METIKVHVVQYPDRANLVMRYTDPGTGRMAARSTGTTNRREAERQAAKWEAELQSGRYSKSSRMKWADFRDYYAANALPALADSSVLTYEATLNVFERICKPQRLADVTTFATQLRKAGRSEATIARHLRHLKAAMRWANREGLLPSLPAFTMPKRIKGAKLMRGRPITLEEFERMLSATTKIVGEANAEPWKFYLRGLWESGLRLSESLALRWDDAPSWSTWTGAGPCCESLLRRRRRTGTKCCRSRQSSHGTYRASLRP